MSVAASQNHRISLAGQADIVSIMSEAPQQHRVLFARNRLSDGVFLDGQSVGGQLTRRVLRRFRGGLLKSHNDSIPVRLITLK